MTSSEDSDEDRTRFEECVYPVTLSSGAALGKSKTDADVPLLSNRILPEENMQFDYRSVRVPEKLQRHVTEHLDKLLSSETKFVKVAHQPAKKETDKSKKRKKKRDSGVVKLLRSCEQAVDLDAILIESVHNKSTLATTAEISDSERVRRAEQVAVSGEYVLSKKEVEAWAPENKGTVEIVTSSHNKPKR